MSNEYQRPVFQHQQYLPIKGNDLAYECVVLREYENGDKAFIDLTTLSELDLNRLRKIVQRRDAMNYPLWDLMSQTTLQNGMNALEYFHQLVQILTPNGTVHTPTTGVRSVGVKPINQVAPNQQAAPAQDNQNNSAE